VELDSDAYGSPVVKSRQKVRKRGQFAIELAVVASVNRIHDYFAQQLSFAVFGDQKRVHRIVAAERPDDMVVTASQPVAAHHAKIVEFARQPRTSLGCVLSSGREKELAYEIGAGIAVLIPVNVIRTVEFENTVFGTTGGAAYLRQYVMLEITVK
jgi:hypothetical protein